MFQILVMKWYRILPWVCWVYSKYQRFKNLFKNWKLQKVPTSYWPGLKGDEESASLSSLNSEFWGISKILKIFCQIKCILLKLTHFKGFCCNSKIEGDISISFGDFWSWTPCTLLWRNFSKAVRVHFCNIQLCYIYVFCWKN